jgi:capsular polysaccharide biosynthesis protein
VAQSLNPEIDQLPDGTNNGDHENGEVHVAPSQNGQSRGVERSLVIRQPENGVLSAYVPAGPGLGTIDAAAPGMSFTQLAHALRRRWLVAILAGLMVGLPAAAVVWLVTPNNFEVTSTLRVGMPKGGLDGIVSGDTQIYEQYRRTQVGFIRTDLVLGAALRKEGILDLPMLQAQKGTPKQFLSDEIFVVAPLGSEMVQIKMRGKDAQQLVKIVNAVTESYMENVVNAERNDLLYEHQTLEGQLRELKKELNAKVEDLKGLVPNADATPAEVASLEVGIFEGDGRRTKAPGGAAALEPLAHELSHRVEAEDVPHLQDPLSRAHDILQRASLGHGQRQRLFDEAILAGPEAFPRERQMTIGGRDEIHRIHVRQRRAEVRDRACRRHARPERESPALGRHVGDPELAAQLAQRPQVLFAPAAQADQEHLHRGAFPSPPRSSETS